MNRKNIKNIISCLRYVDMVSENMLDVACIEGASDEACEQLGEYHDSIHEALVQAARDLHAVYPQLPEICAELDLEQKENSRIFNEQRTEQLHLLRLSGDNTPEEDVPFGAFIPKKGGA